MSHTTARIGAYPYRSPRRFPIRLAAGCVVLLICSLLFIACRGTVRSALGIEEQDWGSETVTGEVSDSGVTSSLLSVISMLQDDTGTLTAFTGSREAVRIYADRILCYMLKNNYGKYTGNAASMEEVAAAYPGLSVTTVISADDFDRMIYRYFGGAYSVIHGNSELFTYLDRVDAYTAPVCPSVVSNAVTVHTTEETEHTYRLSFSSGDGEYLAVFVKRDDGSVYLHSLADIRA